MSTEAFLRLINTSFTDTLVTWELALGVCVTCKHFVCLGENIEIFHSSVCYYQRLPSVKKNVNYERDTLENCLQLCVPL